MIDEINDYPERETNTGDTADKLLVPVVEERLAISSRKVVTGEVTIHTHAEARTVEVPLTTVSTRYREVRVPVGRIVEEMPQVRQENGNLIVPVVREEEVVVKRLVLVEEIHLLRETDRRQHTEQVSLRTEKATVTRADDPQQEPSATSSEK